MGRGKEAVVKVGGQALLMCVREDFLPFFLSFFSFKIREFESGSVYTVRRRVADGAVGR